MTCYEDLSPTLYADALSARNVVHHGIRPLWLNMPRIAGIDTILKETGSLV